MKVPPQPPAALRRFAHLDPAAGMCLMEYVSVLADAPFSDEPACTDPLLGSLARAVSDAMSDTARIQLIGLADGLARVAKTGPEGVRLIEYLCWDAIRSASPPGSSAERRARHRAATSRRRSVLPTGPVRGWIRLHGPARRAVEHAVRVLSRLPVAEADKALHGLLAACVGAVQGDGRDASEAFAQCAAE